MGSRNVSALSVVLFLLFIVNSAFFTVSATERAVLLRFGEVVEADCSRLPVADSSKQSRACCLWCATG